MVKYEFFPLLLQKICVTSEMTDNILNDKHKLKHLEKASQNQETGEADIIQRSSRFESYPR